MISYGKVQAKSKFDEKPSYLVESGEGPIYPSTGRNCKAPQMMHREAPNDSQPLQGGIIHQHKHFGLFRELLGIQRKPKKLILPPQGPFRAQK